MLLRVLTWNLMHGRSVPGAGRDLSDEFASALAGWEWDVALLQEVPPWWPRALSDRLGTEYRQVLTSRNGLLVARRAIATRWPDLIKSNGGGANAILVRRDRIAAHRRRRLAWVPERRVAHGVLLACGIWVVNLHATAGNPVAAQRDCRLAAAAAEAWAAGGPAVLGGDFNLRGHELEIRETGWRHIAERDVDHIFVNSELEAAGASEVLDRGALSDHPPLAVTVRRPEPEPSGEPSAG
jgi:endonuclease/exonuclease/phosphatase family metal-dependent hydrolase